MAEYDPPAGIECLRKDGKRGLCEGKWRSGDRNGGTGGEAEGNAAVSDPAFVRQRADRRMQDQDGLLRVAEGHNLVLVEATVEVVAGDEVAQGQPVVERRPTLLGCERPPGWLGEGGSRGGWR